MEQTLQALSARPGPAAGEEIRKQVMDKQVIEPAVFLLGEAEAVI